jgi:hypothetical protein
VTWLDEPRGVVQLREKGRKERVGGKEERPRRTDIFTCSVLIMSRLLDGRDTVTVEGRDRVNE